MSRKTVKVVDLVEAANNFLASSHDKFKAEREGVHTFVSNILHETGNYRGFNYVHGYDKGDNTRTYFHK